MWGQAKQRMLVQDFAQSLLVLLQPKPSDEEHAPPDESGVDKNRFLLELFYLRLFSLLHILGDLLPRKTRHLTYDELISRVVSALSTFFEPGEDKPDFLQEMAERCRAYEKALENAGDTNLIPIGSVFAEFCGLPHNIQLIMSGQLDFTVACAFHSPAIKEILEKYEVVK